MKISASVIVPTFRGERRLPGLLRALEAQQLARDLTWQVIVVVDGVVDASSVVLDGFHDRLPLDVVVLQQNSGRAVALNAGFERALGGVLIRCDDDLVPGPEFVSRHVAHHRESEAGIVGLCPNAATGTRYDQVYGRDSARRSLADAYKLPADQRWRLWAANCSTTREVFDWVGPYDVGFREYGWEDIDWGYRLRLQGIPVRVERDLQTPHLGVSLTAQTRISRAFASGSARAAFDLKHGLNPSSVEQDGSTGSATTRVWNGLVRTAARDHRQAHWRRLGAAIDAVLPVVPPRAGGKLVALGVEGAGLAGYVGSRRSAT
ncbi:MAG: glycosyltransferase [Actinomycetes bacterium]